MYETWSQLCLRNHLSFRSLLELERRQRSLDQDAWGGLKSTAASFWADDEKMFVLDESGQTFVFADGEEMKVLGVNRIDDLFWSTPSVAGNALLLRGISKLYCIREK